MRTDQTSTRGGAAHTLVALEDVTTRAEFGARLTEVRRRSGRTLRELASAIGSSPSTLSGWCRAENLPFPSQDDTFRAMLRELGVEDPDPWMEALLRVRDAAGSRPADAPPPYRGLASFGTADTDRFFGREALLEEVLARFRAQVEDPARPNVVVLVGASGSGKSSLLHAGIAPRLAADGFEVLTMTPGERPRQRLARTLGRDRVPDGVAADVLTGDEAPPDVGPEASARAEVAPPHRVLLLDQCEELFTSGAGDQERVGFLAQLEELTDPGAAAPSAAVLALRIDFYGELVATGHLAVPLQQAQVLVGPMTREEVTRAIVEPARRDGVSVDDELVALLLRDFVPSGSLGSRHDVGALPLLSHALLETWTRSRRGRMTVADYHAAGGLTGAVERSAELAYQRCSDAERELARQVFLRLVNLDPGEITTRRVASLEELEGLTPDGIAGDDAPTQIRDLLDVFVDARLLTAGDGTVEISHEALLTAWPRLRRWIDEDREALRLHRRITEATHLWLANDRDPSLLARGVLLDAMRETIHAGAPLRVTADERRYLDASIDHAEEEARVERRRSRRLRVLATVATLSAVLAGSLALVAAQARSDALTARDAALSRQVALTADRSAASDPSLAAQLAVVGYDIAATPEARATLLDASIDPRASRLLGGPGTSVLDVTADGTLLAVSNAAEATVQLFVTDGGAPARAATVPLAADEAESYALALSPDGQVLAVGDTTASISLWDVGDPTTPTALGEPLAGPSGPIQGLAFAPDGSELAAVGLGDGAFRWDVRDAAAPAPLPLLPSDEITWSITYHPEGGLVAVGDEVGLVGLWDVTGAPRLVAEVTTDGRSVLDVAIAPDGDLLVAGTRGGQVFAWSLDDPADPTAVEVADATFDSWVNAVGIAPDGSMVAAGSSDGALRLWSTGSWEPRQDLPHPAAVTGAVFTEDGATLVSAATDGTARRWDLATSLPANLAGRIWSVGFTDDGTRLAAFSGAETGIWDVTAPASPAPVGVRVATPADGPSFSGAGAMSPDGRLLAHGTFSGEVVVYDVRAPDAPVPLGAPLAGSEALVETVAFSPDGSLLAAGGVDTDVRVWRVADLPDAPPVAVLTAPTEIVLNLAWSPTGRYLAAPSADNHVYLFDLADVSAPVALPPLGGFDSEAYGAAFTPDERYLATAGSDAIVLRWDLADPSAPEPVGDPLRGPTGRIFDLAFAPDGTRLAAAVVDGSAWVWDTADLATPQVFAVLGSGTSPLYTLAFDPSGQLLAASGADMRVRLWHLDGSAAIDTVCTGAGDPITEQEWERYLPDRPYAPPCAD